ncbi:MAG: purine-nucleoside phosphorylase [Clostridia bacterium]|nr:purine-nucleoside phosphorylase [Clostridia bacterium]
MSKKLMEAASFIRSAAGTRPQAVIVMGSGLGSYADQIEADAVIPYADIPGWPQPTAPGHAGRLILGRRRGVPVAALSGRLHCYEGYSAAETVIPLQTLLLGGAKFVFLTNAAGAIRTTFRPGSLMLIEDHINMTGMNPLTGPNDDTLGTRFPDMSGIYDAELNEALQKAAEAEGFYVERGVYAWMAGPSYETPAEIRALRVLGADAVGMSTVPEAVAARHAGARLAAVSCLSNLAAGVGSEPLTEEEVLEAGAAASGSMMVLADAFLDQVRQLNAS